MKACPRHRGKHGGFSVDGTGFFPVVLSGADHQKVLARAIATAETAIFRLD
jgi:hypothetical protein